MEYLVYCRDRRGALELRWKLVEEHWSFMDRYAASMIARGPTLADDLETPTGSVHIVDLADAEAVRVFAFDEPNYRAGVYDDVLVRRFVNTLGRTMWEFTDRGGDDGRFLILAHAKPGMTAAHDAQRIKQAGYLAAGGHTDRLIAYGPLLSDDGAEWLGTAMLAELPDEAAARTVVAESPVALAGLYDRIEVHHWRFGGRQ